MCVGQASRQGGVQKELWSLSSSSRYRWRMARTFSVLVCTTMPSATAVEQLVGILRAPSTSTMHMRQAEVAGSRGS